MPTILKTANGYSVVLEQIKGLGAPWIVRSYRKVAFLRRRLSSDWFLNGDQARAFAEQLVQTLDNDKGSMGFIQHRKPGWTLRRPSR
jgi:hypothetical protein